MFDLEEVYLQLLVLCMKYVMPFIQYFNPSTWYHIQKKIGDKLNINLGPDGTIPIV